MLSVSKSTHHDCLEASALEELIEVRDLRSYRNTFFILFYFSLGVEMLFIFFYVFIE